MAKKTKKQKQQRTAPRRPAGPQRSASGNAAAGIAESPAHDVHLEPPDERELVAAGVAPAGEPPPDEGGAVATSGTRRRLERVAATGPASAPRSAGRQQRGTSTAAMFQPLEPEDAAIPFDRVPYVPSDLRRVAMIAVCMVVLIVIAAVVVSHVVT